MTGEYLGIDLGATHLRTVVGDRTGTVHGRERRETPSGPDGEAITTAILESIDAACGDAGVDPSAIVGAAIGSIGPLALDEGAVVDPANLPDVDRIELVDAVNDRLEVEVRLHNDATAGAIAERFAANDDVTDLVYLTLSTGIGAGAIVDGQVLTGVDGNAVEVGHVTVDPDAPVRCGCGATGHWEALCGGANLPAYAAALQNEADFPTSLDPPDCSPADLLEAVGSDPLATRLAERIGQWNAIGVATLVQAYDPERIVVGGAIARNHPETILQPIRSRLPDLCLVEPPAVRLTELGDETVVRGALASAVTDGTGKR